MTFQNIAERPLIQPVFYTMSNLSLNKSIKKNGRQILTRKNIKIITSEQKQDKRRKNYLHLKKEKQIEF